MEKKIARFIITAFLFSVSIVNAEIIPECNDVVIIRAFVFLKNILNIMRLLVPILLIVMASVDLVKIVTSGEPDKKGIKPIIYRALAAVIIFFVPTIVNLLVGLIDMTTSYETCWGIADSEYLAALEEEIRLQEEAEEDSSTDDDSAEEEPPVDEDLPEDEPEEDVDPEEEPPVIDPPQDDTTDEDVGFISSKVPSTNIPSVNIAGDGGTMLDELASIKKSNSAFVVVNHEGAYAAYNTSKTWNSMSTIKLITTYYALTKDNRLSLVNSGLINPTLIESDNDKYETICVNYATKSGMYNWFGNVIGNINHSQLSCWQNLVNVSDIYRALAYIKNDGDDIKNKSNGVLALNTMWDAASKCSSSGLRNLSINYPSRYVDLTKYKIYEKTGSGDGRFHDIGIVENKNDKSKYYIYVVFTDNQASSTMRDEALKTIHSVFKNTID